MTLKIQLQLAIKRTPVKIGNLKDLEEAVNNGLERGHPIILSNPSAGFSKEAVFLSTQKARMLGDVIVTVEHGKNAYTGEYGAIRGLYLVEKEGLYCSSHCEPYPGDEKLLVNAGLLKR